MMLTAAQVATLLGLSARAARHPHQALETPESRRFGRNVPHTVCALAR